MPIRHIHPVPQSEDGFYATNNPYQVDGPKGFMQYAMESETADLFLRYDLPGCSVVAIALNPSKNKVHILGKQAVHVGPDSANREYYTEQGLSCNCCQICNIEDHLENGVLRVILSKKRIKLNIFSLCFAIGTYMTFSKYWTAICNIFKFFVVLMGMNAGMPTIWPNYEYTSASLDMTYTGPDIEPNPFVTMGPESAYESKQLPGGGLFLRIDMPGVSNDKFRTEMEEDGSLIVIGIAPRIMHDSSGREYRGKVAVLPRGYDKSRIETLVIGGVLLLTIPA